MGRSEPDFPGDADKHTQLNRRAHHSGIEHQTETDMEALPVSEALSLPLL